MLCAIGRRVDVQRAKAVPAVNHQSGAAPEDSTGNGVRARGGDLIVSSIERPAFLSDAEAASRVALQFEPE
jgi:hypothetical protein